MEPLQVFFQQGEGFSMFKNFFGDEAGFIVSSELVLVATIIVLGLIVGLSEIQHAIVAELNDVADAVGAVNQSYSYAGVSSVKSGGRIKAQLAGSYFNDTRDECDNNQCQISCDAPSNEARKGNY